MARRRLLLAAVFLTWPLPVLAGVTVIGAGNARMCYVAAESKLPPRAIDMRRCNEAVTEERGDPAVMVATFVNRGILRLRRGDIAGAMADFDEATALNPEEPEAYLNRASALLRREEVVSAIAQFDTAIAKQTRRPALAYYGRAVAHEEAGNVRAAYRDYRRASELAPAWDQPRRELTRFRVAGQ
jgi:Flp pilus assembly protein TadD